MPFKNKQDHNSHTKEWRNKQRQKGICTRCGKNKTDKWACFDCRNKAKKYSKNAIQKVWNIIFKQYGSICICCKENNIRFLTLDHINTDGANHKKQSGQTNMPNYIARLIKENKAPKDIQILCYNCNCGRYRNGGICPHVM